MYPITYWGSVPFAAPCPHRCAAFPKVRFGCSVGGEEGEGRGRRGGRELVRCYHCTRAIPSTRCRYILPYTHEPTLCDPPWDHLIRLPGGASGDLVAACSPLYVAAHPFSQIKGPSPHQIGTLPSAGAGCRAFGRIVSVGGV